MMTVYDLRQRSFFGFVHFLTFNTELHFRSVIYCRLQVKDST